MIQKKIKWLILSCGLFLTVSLALFNVVCAKEKDPKRVSVKVEKPVAVRVMEIQLQDLPLVVESIGRLCANRQVTIAAQIPGIIAGYRADVGDRVKAAQVLIRIDPVDYKLALEEAKANLIAVQAQLESAAKAFQRSKDLLPRKVISSDNFEKAETAFKAAQAQEVRAKVGVKIAQERLKKTRLTAPFSAMVAARHIEVGQMIGAGVPLMILVDLNPIRVKVFLSERDYVHLDRHDPVRIKVEAYPDRIFKGRIDRIGITADSATNTFAVEILVDNQNLTLKAGLSARVYLTTRVLTEIIMVPQSAILYREKGPEVFVLGSDKRAQKRRVTLGLTKGALIQVLEGLTPGERLIVKGQNYLKPKARVTVIVSGTK
jgi:RND family efflux transporter MFP subunit